MSNQGDAGATPAQQPVANPVQENAAQNVNPMYNAPEGEKQAPNVPQDNPREEADHEFARKFTALSRKEKEIREALDALEQDRAAVEEARKQYQVNQDLAEQLKYNPLKVLEEHGYKIDDLAKIALNGNQLPADAQIQLTKKELETKMQQEIEALRNQYEENERTRAEQEESAAIENFKFEIDETVKAARDQEGNPRYELIAAQDASDLVYSVVEQHYQDTGNVLSIEEAADEVEKYLEGEVQELLKRNKVRGFLAQDSKSDTPVSAGQGSPTLSNDLSSQSPTTKSKMSREESLQAAAKLLRWND